MKSLRSKLSKFIPPGRLPEGESQMNTSMMSQFLQTQPNSAAQGNPFYQQMLNAKRAVVKQGQVFIIMQFEGMDDVHSVIQEECSRLGLTAKRADKVAGGGLVMADVDLFIRESEFIICDLSNERPNVYYELGYAHGAGNISKNTLLIAKKNTTLHFDIASLRIEPYSDIAELRSVLATKLELLSGRRAFVPRAKEPSVPNFSQKL